MFASKTDKYEILVNTDHANWFVKNSTENFVIYIYKYDNL